MIRGIENFREWFRGYEEQYVIIGGTACDLLMDDAGLSFRVTKDIDLVLIVEAIDAEFGKRFWEFVIAGGYEHLNKSSGQPQFFRFSNPLSEDYPAMIELFTRKPDMEMIPEQSILSPIPIDETVSSLSAILLDDDYYEFLKAGRVKMDEIIILDALHLIPFKVKAWLDLSARKADGEMVDSKNIRKHKNDVFRLSELLDQNQNAVSFLPDTVRNDMKKFIDHMEIAEINLNQLGIYSRTKDMILEQLMYVYGIK